MKKILIVSPFRNEELSIPYYLDALKTLTYPSDLIDIYWLENDSSDQTNELLFNAFQGFRFAGLKIPGIGTIRHSYFQTLEYNPMQILGPLLKNPPGDYHKDIPYGSERIKSWLVIWNEYFLPRIRQSDADYVLIWFGDAVPPPTVIEEYLKVFEEKPDAGWVGGAMHRHYPRHEEVVLWLLDRKEPPVYANAPRPDELPRVITEVRHTNHIWMMPTYIFEQGMYISERFEWDIWMGLVTQLHERGLKVYYQPSVYIKHVSTDGKIWQESL